MRNHNRGCVLVLWTNSFEEALVTIFTTELRKVGLPVKVVGLHNRRATGAHGMKLVPDMTLDDALQWADDAICVVISCDDVGVKRLEGDPRLNDFFSRARTNGALFIFGQVTKSALASSNLFSRSTNYKVVYPDQEDLVGFARDVAHSLVEL